MVRFWGLVGWATAAIAGAAAVPVEKAWARHPALERVLADANALAEKGVRPVVVMDLDETVIDSTPRRRAGYQAAARDLCAADVGPASGPVSFAACEGVRSLNLAEMYRLKNRYDERELAQRLGLEAEGAEWKALAGRSLVEYLSGRYEHLDQPLAGANSYVRALKRAGTLVWFVSSRFQEAQGASTLANLRALGMIAPGEEFLISLRPEGMSSIEFKRRSFAGIRRYVGKINGVVVGAFENEPENMTAMSQVFPEAKLVLVEGAWLKDVSVPPQASRIVDYR